MAAKDEYMTVDDVMALYHVTRRTVYQWVEDGRLKGRKAGRRWLFARRDVKALLTSEGR